MVSEILDMCQELSSAVVMHVPSLQKAKVKIVFFQVTVVTRIPGWCC